MFEYSDGGLPIKVWIDKESFFADDSLVRQMQNLSRSPVAYHHVALMPDGHPGMGMPIGGVVACKDHLIPAAVGADIGCGMSIHHPALFLKNVNLEELMQEISDAVPVGYKSHDAAQTFTTHLEALFNQMMDNQIYPEGLKNQWKQKALSQLGTLGSGNHFIEIQRAVGGTMIAPEDDVAFMIHSGSRNVGKQIADFYIAKAKEYCQSIGIEETNGLDFLPAEHPWGMAYIDAMNFCLAYAKENRDRIFNNGIRPYIDKLGYGYWWAVKDAHHNYASLEDHFGEKVWVHRKGAIFAGNGAPGIIPGSMTTESYTVRGLGNPESFNSASHGCGRIDGRKCWQRKYSREDAIEHMAENNVEFHIGEDSNFSDECAWAYKDPHVVLQNEKDLVKITYTYKPVAVVKG